MKARDDGFFFELRFFFGALGLIHYLGVAAHALDLCIAVSAPIWLALPWHFSPLLLGYDLVSWVMLGAVGAFFTARPARSQMPRAALVPIAEGKVSG